jgi:hypothetical protein
MWLLRVLGVSAGLFIVFIAIRRGTFRVEPRSHEGEAVNSAVGGGTWFSMWCPWGATWPLVRLDQFAWGVRIGPNLPLMAWVLPTTDMRWSDILGVRRTKMTIRFTRRETPSHWVSFGYLGYEPDPGLVAALREHGIPYGG